MAKDDTETEPVIIKKYANRRLYNTDKSSYVTLENLAEMVREGQDFIVTDAKSGEDITRSVLTQIIFEEEAKGQNMLPTGFLRQLIRLYGDTLQGFVPAYLETSMETFARNQESMREQMASAFGANPALANFEAMARSNMEMMQQAMRMFTPFAAEERQEDAEEAAAPTAPAERDESLDQLKAQVDILQKQLEALSKKQSQGQD